MPMLERVLFPVDFSDAATSALPQVVRLAAKCGAELHLLHVTVLHDVHPTSTDEFPTPEALQTAIYDEAARLLEHLDTTGTNLAVVRARARAISAGPAILDYARTHDIDLIAMPTHGRRGLRRLVLGSVTEEVLRHAECPVLTLRSPSHGDLTRAQVLLVPLDLGPETGEIVAWAKYLASWSGARIELVHVVEAAQPPLIYDTFGVDLTVDIDALVAESLGHLERIRDEAGLDTTSCGVHALAGPGWQIILEWAEGQAIDAIVLGPGSRGIDRLLLGSTVERVVRQAPCPVLVVRSNGSRRSLETAAVASATSSPW